MNWNPKSWFNTLEAKPIQVGTVLGSNRAEARLQRVTQALRDNPTDAALLAEVAALTNKVFYGN